MKGLAVKKGNKVPDVVKRLAGGAHAFSALTSVKISEQVLFTTWQAGIEPAQQPEEHGRIINLPLGDGAQSLQLLYVQQQAGGEGILITCLEFHPQFFEQWPIALLDSEKLFAKGRMAEQQFNLCAQCRLLLEELSGLESPKAFTQALKALELVLQLVRRSADNLAVPFAACQVPACRFLAFDSEREKIFKARTIIEQQFDQQLTIKDLARKVAMNECYLKKGFKALVGKTIHEYQQEQRITHARQMLGTGQSVTNVADLLGYSSISHFSTAFKKATGLKPCELLK